MKTYSKPWKTTKPTTPISIARGHLAAVTCVTAIEYPIVKRTT